MKILHIAPTPFFSNRGCHIRIENIMRACDTFASSSVCTYHHGNSVPNREIHRIWKVPGYTKRTAGFSVFKIFADILLFFLVLKWTVKEKPEVLHGHLHEGALIAWCVRICLFWKRIPLVMDMQGSLYRELIAYNTFKENSLVIKVFRGIEKIVYHLPGHFICSSQASCNILTEEFFVSKNRITLLEDSVPEGFLSGWNRKDARKKLGISNDTLLILYTGSLISGKGLQTILAAIPDILKNYHLVKFCLAGYPVQEAKKQVVEMGAEKRVLLPGEVPYYDLPAYLAAADIALEPKLAKSGEASGKLMHYMAAGLPVVCFRTANNVQILGEDAEYALGQTAAFFQTALAKIIESPELRRSLRRKTEEKFLKINSTDFESETLQKVYKKLKP